MMFCLLLSILLIYIINGTAPPSLSPTMEPTLATSQPSMAPTKETFDPKVYINEGIDFNDPNVKDCRQGCSFSLYVRALNVSIKDINGDIIAVAIARSFCVDENNITNCRYIGPTIVSNPGVYVNITLVNKLHGVGRLKILNPTKPLERFHDPDVVNLHTHGLHVSSHMDDVTKWVSPICPIGIHKNLSNLIATHLYDELRTSDWDLTKLDCYESQSETPGISNKLTYNYYIPSHHYPGTHWYHAHWHGATALHVVSGLYGTWIINEPTTIYQPKMKQVILMIAYAFLHTYEECVRVTKGFTKCSVWGENAYRRPSDVSSAKPLNFPIQSACTVYCATDQEEGAFNVTSKNGSIIYENVTPFMLSDVPYFVKDKTGIRQEYEGFLVNGHFRPGIKMTTNSFYQFRITNTVMNYLIWWPVDKAQTNCKWYVMGRDGIYFENGPRDLSQYPYRKYQVIIQPGSRADIKVRCSIAGDYTIYASNFTSDEEPAYLVNAPCPRQQTPILKLIVTDNGTTLDPTYNGDHTLRPYSTSPYLTSTLNKKTSPFCSTFPDQTVNGKSLKGFPNTMSQCDLSFGRKGYPAGQGKFQPVTVNNVAFDPTTFLNQVCYSDSGGSNSSHEWIVTSNFHPFHHHTWPFQLQTELNDGWFGMPGDWRDTVGTGGSFRVRSNYVNTFYDNSNINDVFQKLVVHCHFVPHEDHGMMQLIFVNNSCGLNQQYIEPTPISYTVKTGPVSSICSNKKAQTLITSSDSNFYLYTKITTNDCWMTLEIRFKPRDITIGNAWFSIAYDKTISPANITQCDSLIATNGTQIKFGDPNYYMLGRAFIFSLTAKNGNPLSVLSVGEYTLSVLQRTTTLTDTYITCGAVSIENGVVGFTCKRPLIDPFDKFGDSGAHFVYAYGEGNFKPDKTLHATRGGCDYCFKNAKKLNTLVICNREGDVVKRYVAGIDEIDLSKGYRYGLSYIFVVAIVVANVIIFM